MPGITTKAKILPPTAGRNNLYPMRDMVKRRLASLQNMLGKDHIGSVKPQDQHHAAIKREILGMMSTVLQKCPLEGTDGPPGNRTYVALPMDFRGDAHLLRKLGEHLAPDRYNADLLKKIVGQRYELYKLEVSVPSDLIGFNLDGMVRGKEPFGLMFECYDGGQVFPASNNRLMQIAQIKMFFEPEPDFKINLHPFTANVHDINT